MRVAMKAIEEAKELAYLAETSLAWSQKCRMDYIQGMKDGLSDDDLRNIHYNAMDAFASANKAFSAKMGERKYSYG